MRHDIHIGTAGWQIPAAVRAEFEAQGSGLQRYAGRFNGVEINSTFRRAHRPATYERWAASVPPGFRFSVKMPRAISHELQLEHCREPLESFLEQLAALGEKLDCLLLQLPPKFAWDERVAVEFFTLVHELHPAQLVVEPRHASWFTPAVDAILARHAVARAATDPAIHVSGSQPGGDQGFSYFRWHGSPRTYYSNYEPPCLATLAGRLHLLAQDGRRVWCIFDNTAAGCAAPNALSLVKALRELERTASAQ